MTLTLKEGDIMQTRCEALVIPVNCVGVMGAGLALLARKKFPDYFDYYKAACRNKELLTGWVHVYGGPPQRTPEPPYYIISFPTKYHWRDNSDLRCIEFGLVDLVEVLHMVGIKSVAIPALGCGLGGLDWNDVYPLIVESFAAVEELHADVYTRG